MIVIFVDFSGLSWICIDFCCLKVRNEVAALPPAAIFHPKRVAFL